MGTIRKTKIKNLITEILLYVNMLLEHVVHLNANSRRWGRDEEEEEEGVGESKAYNNGREEMWSSFSWII